MSRQLSIDYELHESPEYLAESFGPRKRFMRYPDKRNFIKCSGECGHIVPEDETIGGVCPECNDVDKKS